MPCAPNAAKNPAQVNLFGLLPLSPTNHSWAGRKGFTSPFFFGCSPRANRIRGAYMVDGVLRDNVCVCVCVCDNVVSDDAVSGSCLCACGTMLMLWQCCWRRRQRRAEELAGCRITQQEPHTIMLEIVENVCLSCLPKTFPKAFCIESGKKLAHVFEGYEPKGCCSVLKPWREQLRNPRNSMLVWGTLFTLNGIKGR